MEVGKELIELRQEIGDCHRCALACGRTKIVFGAGNIFTKVFIVGEGPGEKEDNEGLPFVGRSGELLNSSLKSVGREDVYVGNIVKCRPPGNRAPSPAEQKECGKFLLKQIEIVSPRVVLALGKTAAEFLLAREVKITKERGTFFKGKDYLLGITYHPSFLLRNVSRKHLEDFRSDLSKAFNISEGFLEVNE